MGENEQGNGQGNVNLDAYSFGTLWQEATRGVGYFFNMITDTIGIKQSAKIKETEIKEQSKVAGWSLLKRDSNTAILSLVAVIGFGALFFFASKMKK